MILVTTTADAPDVNLADGQAKDSQGRVTLRAAIQHSKQTANQSTIILVPDGNYILSVGGSTSKGENAAPLGDLDIERGVSVQLVGSGSSYNMIDGMGATAFSTSLQVRR